MRRALVGLWIVAAGITAGCSPSATRPTPRALECLSDSPETIKPGVLTVGSDLAFAPMESIDPQTQKPVGFDIELITEIAKRMNMQVEFINQTFSGIIPALLSKKFDVIVSSMTITNERDAQICMSDEYFEAEQSLIVKSAAIKGTDDLNRKTVGVQAQTTGEDWAKENLRPEVVTIKAFETSDDAFLDLKAGKIDGVIIDLPVGLYRQRTDPEMKLVEEIITSEAYGFAVHPENGALIDELDEKLEAVQDEGVYDSLYEKWFGRKP